MAAEKAGVHEFDQPKFFEGCLPIEVMAARGVDTLRFGPMKPVGLPIREPGGEPYAVVQLRQDNIAGDHFSLVGFQTQMKWGEQARVLRMIPGLEHAEFVRFGMIHRNTYVNAPTVLRETWQTRMRADLFFAGQMSGVEGYVESAASGLIAGRNAAALALGESRRRRRGRRRSARWPITSSHADPKHYVPSNIAFGLDPAARPAGQEQEGSQYRDFRARARGSADVVREHLKAFLEHLRLNENASAHTVRAYDERSLAVPRLSRARISTGASSRARRRRISIISTRARSSRDLHKRGQSKASAARKLSAIRAFGRYLRREGVHRERSGGARRARRSASTASRTHLAVDEMAKLLETPDTVGSARPPRQGDPELFYASGLRLSELVGLDVEDVNLVGARGPRAAGRGARSASSRSISQRSGRAARVGWWIASDLSRPRPAATAGHGGQSTSTRGRRSACYAATARSCSSTTGADACRRAQRRQARAALRRAVQHALRHQPARAAAFVRDAPARSAAPTCAPIQELLGHARLSTTQRYTHVNAAQLIDDLPESAPKA